ncbi:hypothetical protein [Sulfobacillus thermosulfidooxidans]|uniref:hypothetical protein n=1 Tax=Sulfobacillus thermosulfidooxidans TaxID=28034 RepID=UPI0002EA2CDE|nr:hypothetical protein [Sulfobacillus thermosulfidooxidans]
MVRHQLRLMGITGILVGLLAGCGMSLSTSGVSPKSHGSPLLSAQSPVAPSSSIPTPSIPAAKKPSSSGNYTDQAPIIVGTPGAIASNEAWPIRGSQISHTGTSLSTEQFTRQGFVIDGVHWLWPQGDTHPNDYLVVPTVISGRPYLIWAHLGHYTGNGVSRYPEAPAQLWMTPWRSQGGLLSRGAQLLTSDIPPIWSTTGQSIFAKRMNVASMAETAWIKWFHWGLVSHPYNPGPVREGQFPTVAWPETLYPAYNGIILVIETHLFNAAQGVAFNVYYLNLQQRTITGLASLSNGGGLFMGVAVWNGLVLDGEASLGVNGKISASVVTYNEVTGQRTMLPSSATIPNFYGYELVGQNILNNNGDKVTKVSIPLPILYSPSSQAF